MHYSVDHKIISLAERDLRRMEGPGEGPDSASAALADINGYRSLFTGYTGKIGELHAGGASGPLVCRLLTELADRFVMHAFNACFPGDSRDGTAIYALGGYGRRELCPFSDVDILFLMDGRSGKTLEARISSLLRFLWDLNLDLGHSTRTVEECILGAENDSFLATSLIEARFLAGSESLRNEFAARFDAWLKDGAARDMALQKIEERRVRIDSFNGTPQIQTPNVKESPGGLRDIHLSRWLLALSNGGGEIDALSNKQYLDEEESYVYEHALNFLLRVRNALHFVSGKKADVLNHLILPEIASNLGYSGERVQPVESLMHDYYYYAGNVFRLTNRVVERYLERSLPQERKPLAVLPIGLRTNSAHVALLIEKESFLDSHPHLAVEIFTVAGLFGLHLTENSASVIERWGARRGDTFPKIPEVQSSFHELLNMRKGVSHAVRLLHEHGILTRLIPEFGGIAFHYQYDFYHAFTTDEHSVRVVENLEKMAAGTFEPFPEMHEIMADVTAKGALYLTGILHDIGKAEKRSHSLHGERMAVRAMRRLNFDDRTVELVRFLIREHLLMSHTSQRRDMDDPDTIRGFIERVRSEGMLRMLTALTFADLAALSSGALTDWKKSLLWGLYTRARLLIEKGYEHSVSLHDVDIEQVVKKLGKTVDEHMARSHIRQLPQQYLLITPRQEIKQHINGIETMKLNGMWVSFNTRKGLTYLTVICRDYPRALSDICGTITASDINIVAARIFTRADGIIIDTFVVVGGKGETVVSAATRQAFRDNFARVITGGFRVEDLIRGHAIRWKRRKRNVVYYPPRVRADNSISSRYTVLDVFATDYTGLLYDITSVLAENGVDIHTARIGTDEDQVADAFYIRKPGGGKIEGEELEKLTREIIERIENVERISGFQKNPGHHE